MERKKMERDFNKVVYRLSDFGVLRKTAGEALKIDMARHGLSEECFFETKEELLEAVKNRLEKL